MNKQLLLLAPILFLAACAQGTPMSKDSMHGKMMSGGCSCCQKMMKDGAMDMGMKKNGKMQCPMMDGSQKSSIPTATTPADHAKHHQSK